MSDQHNNVRAYYKTTDFDYEHFWAGRQARALHFGYFDAQVQTHEQSLLRMNQVLAHLAHITPADSVLDAGCGYGGSSMWLARSIGCQATGITLVADQVRKAREHIRGTSAEPRLRFVEGDYANTGLPPASFTVVWGLESIVHCEDKARFVREAYRLLAPGGRLLIAEYMLRDNPPLSLPEQEIMEPFLKGWMMPSLLTPTQYRDSLIKAGFKNLKVHDLSNQVEPSLLKCRRNASLALPFVGALKRLGLINAIRRDYTIANYELYDSFRAGLWQYKVIIGVKPG